MLLASTPQEHYFFFFKTLRLACSRRAKTVIVLLITHGSLLPIRLSCRFIRCLPVAAQANSIKSSNVDVIGLYVDGSKGEKNSGWRHCVRTMVQLTFMGCSYNAALPSSN
jgi:hypothetical protein